MSDAALVVEHDPPREQILRLLGAAGLSTGDISPGAAQKLFAQKFFGFRDPGQSDRWLGVIGVERHCDEALLRSLAVDPAARHRGLGAQLVGTIEAWARAQRCRRVVLLTIDAQAYFSDLGYRAVARQSLSKVLAGSSQLTSVCPTSATVMAKDLAED